MKAKTATSDDIRQKIELRAYFIWEREGRPQGCEAEHWALAEAEILSEKPVPKAEKNSTRKEAAPQEKPKSKATKPDAAPKNGDRKVKTAAAKKKKAVKAKAVKPPSSEK